MADEYPKMMTRDGRALVDAKGKLIIVNSKQEEEAVRRQDARPVRNHELDTSHKKPSFYEKQ